MNNIEEVRAHLEGLDFNASIVFLYNALNHCSRRRSKGIVEDYPWERELKELLIEVRKLNS